MNWSRVSGAERYRVYRSTSGSGNYTLLDTVSGLTYTDSSARAGTTYYYKVEAVFPNGQTVCAQKSITAATATPGPTVKPVSQSIKVGGYITFGHYEQDNNTGNGKEPIEWLVLEVQGKQALVISRYGLDCKPYNTSQKKVTWETCSLRKWLNGEFLDSAFTPMEQSAIVLTKVDNSASQGNSRWNTGGSNDTKDKVFLLSYAETLHYFKSTVHRKSMPTEYAVSKGAYEYGCWWWMRSPGYNESTFADVGNDGSLRYSNADSSSGSVRPALWINLDAGIF